jgi:hypothetical protein
MGQAQTKEQKATQRHVPPPLPQNAVVRHEVPAKPAHDAPGRPGYADTPTASHHDPKADAQAAHAPMSGVDPQSLPQTNGTVSKFLFNVHGDADGFLLDGEHQVHLPPHLSAELLKAVKVGDKVVVRGVKPQGVDLLVAASITAANGAEIVVHGPCPKPQKP